MKKNLYINTEQNFFIHAGDPENHDIYVKMEWGDGQDSGWRPYDKKNGIDLKYTWTQTGTYAVTAYAIDDPNGDGDFLSDGLQSDPYSKEYTLKVQRTPFVHSANLNNKFMQKLSLFFSLLV